jgi:hypothetical protein
MARLKERTRGATIKGIERDGLVTIAEVSWHGPTVEEVTYKGAPGRPSHALEARKEEQI